MEQMYNSFLIQKVPTVWTKKSYPCLMPLNSFVNDHLKRLDFIDTWLKTGAPVTFWLSSFFFPQGFMTAAMQTHARKTRIAIDQLRFQSNVTSKMSTDADVA